MEEIGQQMEVQSLFATAESLKVLARTSRNRDQAN